MDINVAKLDKGLKGEIIIPADKSISHRAIMFSSIAKGKTIIKNFLYASDCRSTVSVFQNLGVDIKFIDNNTVEIDSSGKLKPPSTILDCGNSGTTIRLVSGILSGQNFDSTLTGDTSLSKRPMKRIIEPLSLMGADITSQEFRAPLKIKGKHLNSIEYKSPIASAQVKSSILLAGIQAEGTTVVEEPYLSRNHTELMLKYLGADIEAYGNIIKTKKSDLIAKDIIVPGDISSAAFFIVAASIIPDSNIIIKNVGLNPTRTGIIDIVIRMGGNIEILDRKNISGEDVGDIKIKYSSLKGCNINGSDIPRLIDELPIIALMATQADGETKITNAGDLRNKEADRITALVTEFRKLGIDIDELPDGFVINGKQQIKGNSELNVYHDHRLAMTFYVAGLLAKQPTVIKEFQWVDISLPEFLPLMESLINSWYYVAIKFNYQEFN